ncbi:hypothetical protein AM593_00778, partial [Mytilus galloprovincialis]
MSASNSMAYFKLTILVITVVIGLQHGPVHVSCQFFPPPPGIGAFQPPGLPQVLPANARLLPIPVPVPRPVPRPRDRDRDGGRRRIVLVNGGGGGGGPGPAIPMIGGGMVRGIPAVTPAPPVAA